MKRTFIIIIMLLISTLTLASKWTYEGITNGGLMLLYKALPPTIISIDTPEEMTVSKDQGMFWYTDVNKSNQPLKLDISIQFRSQVVGEGENGLNKQIINAIYNQVELTFENNGEFSLNKVSKNKKEKVSDGATDTISAEAFFVSKAGVAENGGKKIQRTFNNTVQNGLLTMDGNPVYIDVQFNKEKKTLASGSYDGILGVYVEFKGKGGLK